MLPHPDRRRPVARFLASFAIIYGLFILPWPGWSALYGEYFRAFNRLIFVREGERRILFFAPLPGAPQNPLDTQITIANRDHLNAKGEAPALFLAVTSRGVGWVPTATLAALILASPVPWRRRAWALLCGMIALHGYIAGFIAVYLWNNTDESSGVQLVTLLPHWKPIVFGLCKTMTASGASFVVPVLLWIVLIFRREDLEQLKPSLELSTRATLRSAP